MDTPEKPLIIVELEREIRELRQQIVSLQNRLDIVEKAVDAYLKRHG